MTNRRSFLKAIGACSALAVTSPLFSGISKTFAGEKNNSYKIGICDWNMPGYAYNEDAFDMAKSLGFQGIQILYNPVGDFRLTETKNRDRYLEVAQETGMQIPSFSMGIFNERPFATDPEAEEWVSDCMDVMHAMKINNLLLAFFSNGDLVDKPDEQKQTIEKLKKLAPKAEKLKLTLSVESYLNVEDHLKIIDGVGSDAVKIYYDSQNMANKGYDVIKDIGILGKRKLISEVHLKDDTHRLIDSPLNYKKISDALKDVGYSGWVVVESSVSGDWKEAQSLNAKYAREIFDISDPTDSDVK